ncbi:2Fe-2S iron-sulfur cluster-binding protein [Leisingera sp. NJS204]|uniref:2Fe-2S iron-sulfur cluster-binding protein n=1 Tax=Leisingera sp. NJS204 TaxID=2508307 RepID=UPI0010122CCB|nr:2Fe-2S iron-sulfur cluster-binding protein [Leisingera sp. NJS204]QAX28739.1 2Fe-2S iron-sulfur cluster binding domain-containing protein [Leisingera sp. NJS204]
MSTKSTLNVIAAYDKVCAEKAELAHEGSNFAADRNAVARQIRKLHPKRLTLTVGEIIRETPTACSLRLLSDDGSPLPPFQAGQYINLFLTVDGVETARPFAISSAPQSRDYYDVTVRSVPGGFVSPYMVGEMFEGQILQSSGPMGSFYYNPLFHGGDLVFLAGGSGVAPAMSMIRDIINKKRPLNFHLIYGSRSTDDIIFRQQLQTLAEQHDFLTVDEVISEPDADYTGHTGYLSAEMVQRLTGDVDGKMFYLCGPNAMYDFCKPELEKLGVPGRRVRIEANGAPPAPQKLTGWPQGLETSKEVTVTVRGRGQFKMPVGEPLLNAMERNGYQAENACRSGECSLCRVKVLSGDVFNPPQSHLRSSDRTFGWTHACVAFALSDIEILI